MLMTLSPVLFSSDSLLLNEPFYIHDRSFFYCILTVSFLALHDLITPNIVNIFFLIHFLYEFADEYTISDNSF